MNISPSLPPSQSLSSPVSRQASAATPSTTEVTPTPQTVDPRSDSQGSAQPRLETRIESTPANRTQDAVRLEETTATQRISPQAVEVVRSQQAVVDVENLPERNRQALSQYLSIDSQPQSPSTNRAELVGVDTFA
ncbi:MAG: hypothetical protein K6L73_03145 [Cellvibrionaceae bacterium]